MKKSTYLSLLGTMFLLGMIIGFLLYVNTSQDNEEVFEGGNQNSYQKEVIVMEVTGEVVAPADGSIQGIIYHVINWL
ncbi:hypothetical protein [Oceanobacillus salinisoli]|uniref:hypothetical protein n=1 Tax=Oceanobacillus salinisoli TaxID=2678611 RepID=UPI0012E1F6DF|nr:hypothetical protein [Oceanobacillus salinisoli]